MTTRGERTQRTRDALIQAGLRLAESVGVAGMSVNLVVQEAGVAKGSFFYHFGDRTGYLLALHRAFHDGIVTEALSLATQLPPGAEWLWSGAIAYLDGCLQSRGVRALLLEARAIPAIANEIRDRNEQVARLCAPHFTAMEWEYPLESGRLWTGMIAEAALLEFDAHAALPPLREALRRFLA